MKWSIEAVLLVAAAAMKFFGNSIVERDPSNGHGEWDAEFP
ncbi:hypothetical protein [Leptospira interrogans]|nr:hypothetical protein [Leptospira interrogans]